MNTSIHKETTLAKRSSKIDTTTGTGGDRRSPDPERINERERRVSGRVSSGSRTAGREEGPKYPARDRREGVGGRDAQEE